MMSHALSALAVVSALPALLLGLGVPLANLLVTRSLGLPGIQHDPSVVIQGMWLAFGVALAVVFLGSLVRPARWARGWAVVAALFAVTAGLVMVWVGYTTWAGLSGVGGGPSFVPWVFGPSVALFGVPAALAVLAAAVSALRPIAVSVVAVGVVIVAAGGVGGSVMLAKLTWGVYLTFGSPQYLAMLAYGASIPVLAVGVLPYVWKGSSLTPGGSSTDETGAAQ
ncbi:MAG: hypothetical protein ACI9K2_002778 [Myxococcota bacterium]|jgi:hypothetical protein